MLIVKLFDKAVNGGRKAALLFLNKQRTDAGLAVYKVEEDAVANHQDNNCTVNSSSWGIKGNVAVFITHLKSKMGGKKMYVQMAFEKKLGGDSEREVKTKVGECKTKRWEMREKKNTQQQIDNFVQLPAAKSNDSSCNGQKKKKKRARNLIQLDDNNNEKKITFLAPAPCLR